MKRLTASMAMLFVVTAAAPAAAFKIGANGTPRVYAQRGLTLRKGQVRLDAGPPDFALLDSGARNNGRSVLAFATREFGGIDETFVGLGLGGAYGISNRLEVGTLIMPLLFSPDFEFGDVEFYGRYKFQGGKFEVGAQGTISLPTNTANNQSNFGLVFGVPMILHMSPTARLDVGAELEILLGDADGIVNLDVPAALQFQVDDTFFVGPKAGLFLPNVEEIELGFGGVAGFTIADRRGRPMVDIVAELFWPFFFSSGRPDAVNLDQFNLVLGARVFFSTLSPKRRSRRFPSDVRTYRPETDF